MFDPMRPLKRFAVAAAVVSTAAVLLPAAALPAGTGSNSSLASLGSGVLAELNQIRVAHGLVPVKVNPALGAAAEQHAKEMLRKGYFQHNSANGLEYWQRIKSFYPSAKYRSWSVGENLLWSGGTLDAKAALKLWMGSPAHRANILSPRWREIGIAALYNPAAPGRFGGSPVTLVATDFGFRS
jgi:uncharacterized protein YkwD